MNEDFKKLYEKYKNTKEPFIFATSNKACLHGHEQELLALLSCLIDHYKSANISEDLIKEAVKIGLLNDNEKAKEMLDGLASILEKVKEAINEE